MKLKDTEVARALDMTADNLRKTYKVKKPDTYKILRLGVVCSKLGINEGTLEKCADFIKELDKPRNR